MAWVFDAEKLATMTRVERGSKSLREASDAIGEISTSTLSRVENGNGADLPTLLILCHWLGVPPEFFFRDSAAPEEPPSDVVALIRADENLDPTVRHVLATLVAAGYEKCRGET